MSCCLDDMERAIDDAVHTAKVRRPTHAAASAHPRPRRAAGAVQGATLIRGRAGMRWSSRTASRAWRPARPGLGQFAMNKFAEALGEGGGAGKGKGGATLGASCREAPDPLLLPRVLLRPRLG